ncbi:NAD-dependent epimerase/dehydratase family protein [Symbioplanes lichenis]|uniref:NAD-dependent epimerase/dehydratase family protein n=1 Tax=Symbioplanes lichenis TaxID=1629072 RepID=UPI00273A486A|nr:NAD-dependent epimerase/dehydratase family protein [Actinoplanes lichenis]
MTTDLHVVLGTGPAGTTLAEELLRRGHSVRTVDRKGRQVAPGAEPVAADILDPAAARAAVAGATVVHHCVNVGYEHQVDVMPRVQRTVLDAVAAADARLVVLDTLYPYGPSHGAVLTEQSPWRATSRKGRMRAELDEAYLSSGLPVVLGRAADFYGPRVLNSSLGAAIFPAALTGGTVLALGDRTAAHSVTYIGDVAAGLATLAEAGDGAWGRVWHLPTAPAPTTDEVLDRIRTLTGAAFDVHTLTAAEPWGPFDATFMAEYEELFYQHTEPQIMDSSAFEQAFGVAPVVLDDGLAATIAWYRENVL